MQQPPPPEPPPQPNVPPPPQPTPPVPPTAPAYVPSEPAPESAPRKPRSWMVRILRGLTPLLVIAVGVYLFYNLPALWSKLTYWLHPPKVGNSAMLPRTTTGGSSNSIPTGGPQCGTHPIDYDGNGNPERICDNYIYIPKIRVAAPIIRPTGTSDEAINQALLQGVVKYPGTAEPGERGNVFLTGHSSYYWWVPTEFRNVFTLEPQLTNGDEIFVYHNGIRYSYRVFTTFEVAPTDVDVLAQTPRPIVTLSTCVPVGTSYHRQIVQAEQTAPDPNLARSVTEEATRPARLPGIR